MRDYILRKISAVYYTDENGVTTQCDLVDSLGVSLLSGQTVAAPTLGPAIADRTYVVGTAPVTIDLSERFIGATSYGMTPTNIPGVTRSGAIVTIDPSATRAATTITVSGTNAGGTATMSFTLTVNAVTPTLTTALLDQNLELGSPNVSIPLGSYFANAASYAVSPTGQGVTISGTTMTISAAAERNATYTVTATNSTGQSVTDSFNLTVAAAVVQAQRTIVMADYAGDCDDAAAIAVLAKAHQDGDINMLGVIATSTVPSSAPGVYGQLKAYGMEDVPVYAYQGAAESYNNRFSEYVRDYHGTPGETRAAYQDDVTGLRTLLAAAPDNSVVLVDIGAPVSTARLMDSPADAISPLTGMELITAKVTALYGMAGNFPTGVSEYNMNRNVAASQRVYHDFPRPIIAHGGEVGATIFTGPLSGTNVGADPVRTAFHAFGSIYGGSLQNGNRQSWDPATAFHAIYGDQGLFSLSAAGEIAIDATGVSTWTENPSGNRRYVIKVATDAEIAAALQAVIDAQAITGPAPARAPDKVTGLNVTGSGSSRTLSWTAPNDRGSPITDYIIRLDGQIVADGVGAGTSYLLEGLADGQRTVTVSAVNALNAGLQSDPLSFVIGAVAATSVAFALGEGSGTTVTSAGGRIATLTGGTWESAPARIAFNGAGYLQTDTLLSEGQQSYMLGIVARLDNISGTRALMSRMGSTSNRMFQFRNNGGRLEFVSFSEAQSASVLDAGTAVVAGQWAMFVASVVRGASQTTIQIRKDGQTLLEQSVAQQRVPTVAEPVWVGARHGPSDMIVGDVAAWGTPFGLPATDVTRFEAELRGIATSKGITLP